MMAAGVSVIINSRIDVNQALFGISPLIVAKADTTIQTKWLHDKWGRFRFPTITIKKREKHLLFLVQIFVISNSAFFNNPPFVSLIIPGL